MGPLEPDVRDAYLRRLSLEAEPPSTEALVRLHRRHTERVPYETLWIHGGERWGIEAHDAAARIAFQRRGGYCYHLNGAFAALLHTLGYHVALHAGGVHGPTGPAPGDAGNHLVVTVADLPTDDNPGGEWYLDVGLGDALHEPVPLRPTSVRQGPFQLELERTGDDTARAWHLAHDPDGGFTGMAWRMGTPDPALLATQHEWLSTSPDSGFVKLGLAQTRDATGVDVIHGLIVKRIGTDARASTPMIERCTWFAALGDLFGLTFEGSAPGTTDRLWERTLAAHRAWEASQT